MSKERSALPGIAILARRTVGLATVWALAPGALITAASSASVAQQRRLRLNIMTPPSLCHLDWRGALLCQCRPPRPSLRVRVFQGKRGHRALPLPLGEAARSAGEGCSRAADVRARTPPSPR